jgi:hypothetical protein
MKDPTEDAVVDALANQNWDFRTVDGIVRETGLQPDAVKEVLTRSERVRRSPVPGPNGADLYTLRDRSPSDRSASKGPWLREVLSFLRGAISKSSS